MTIFSDISKLAQNEAAVGVLALSSLFMAGCGRMVSIPESQAIDSRPAAVAHDTMDSLKLPGIDSVRRELTLPEGGGTVALNADKSYGLEIPFGGHYELISAYRSTTSLFSGTRAVTDDALIFSVPDNDLSKYSVTLESHQYCTRGWNDVDGTYVILLKKDNDGSFVKSAIKMSTVSAIAVKEAGKDAPEMSHGEGLVYLKTPDGVLHKVPTLEQYRRSDQHNTPPWIRTINSRIDRVIRADDLVQSE